MGREQETEVREAFRRLYEADLAKGEVRPLDAYQGLFPEYTEVVADEYTAAATRLSPGPGGAEGAPTGGATPHDGMTQTSAGDGSQPPVVDPPPAMERIGPYAIVRELGRGGMGVVYEAEDTRLPRRVALKVLPPQFASSRHLRLRFEREASLAAKLDHPNICTVYEAGEADGIAFMAMRFVDGRPLSDLVAASRGEGGASTAGVVSLDTGGGPAAAEAAADAERPRPASGEGRMSLDRVLELFERIARALHVAHEKGLVHRDIKPHNIMVSHDGEPVLLDFGLAREEDGEGHGLTMTGALMGTPAYMSPEQLVAQRIRLDRRTDVYSLGVSLYECVTLRLPFQAPTTEKLYQQILASQHEDPRRLNRALPDDLRVVLDTALEKNRDRRYQTAAALADELRRVRRHEPIKARPIGPLGRLRRWSERSPAMAATSAALFLSLTAGLLVAVNLLQATRIERDAKEMALGDRKKALVLARDQRDAAETARAEAARERDEKTAALARLRQQALVAESRLAESFEPQRALLLAREAVRRERSPEAVGRLHGALAASTVRLSLQWETRRVMRGATSPDGMHAASLDPNANRVQILRAAGGVRATIERKNWWPWHGFFTADGSELVVIGDRNLRHFDLDGHPTRTLPFEPGVPRLVVVDPAAGRWFAWTGLDGGGGVHALDGKPLLTIAEAPLAPVVLAPSPDGRFVADGRADGSVIVHAIDGSGHRRLWKGPTVVDRLAWGPGSDWLAASTPEGHAAILGLDGTVRWSGEKRLMTPVRLAAHPSRDLLALSTYEEIRLLEPDGHEVAVCRGPSGAVVTVAWSGDGRWLAAQTNDGGVGVWTPTGGLAAELYGPSWHLQTLAWVDDDRRLFLQGQTETAIHAPFEGELAVLHGYDRIVASVDVAPDGSRIATSSEDGTAHLWSPDGRRLADLPHGMPLWAAVFSPDGQRVATMDHRGVLRVFDLEGRLLASHAGPDGGWYCRWIEGGRRLLGVSGQAKGVLWDPITGAHEDVAWDRNLTWFTPLPGTDLLVASHSPSALVRVLTPEGETVREWTVPGASGVRHAVSPDGMLVAAVAAEGRVYLWTRDGKPIRDFPVSLAVPWHAEFSPDGSRLVLVGDDPTTQVVDLEGRLLQVIEGHKGELWEADWLPDGKRIVTASRDGTARIWTTDVDELLRIADERTLRDFTEDERERYADLLGE